MQFEAGGLHHDLLDELSQEGPPGRRVELVQAPSEQPGMSDKRLVAGKGGGAARGLGGEGFDAAPQPFLLGLNRGIAVDEHRLRDRPVDRQV